jgi:signal recognition particle receptor subunit beta
MLKLEKKAFLPQRAPTIPLQQRLALVNAISGGAGAVNTKLTMLRNALVMFLCTFAFADPAAAEGDEGEGAGGGMAEAGADGGSGGMVMALLGVVAAVALIKVAKGVVAGGGVGGGGGPKGDSILLLGNVRAGKTSVFYRMLHGDAVATVTSMAATERAISFGAGEGAAKANVIDFPGHRRLRGGLAAALRRAKAIVFVIDAATVAADLTHIAEFLYEVLTDPSVGAARPPLLVACNKQDARLAKAPEKVRSMVEREMAELQSTRSSMEEEGGGALASLGREDEDFDFDEDSPCAVRFVGCSAADAQIDAVREFIAEHL